MPLSMDRSVKTVAYLRVSTPQQDVRSQRLAILEYARANDVHIDEFIESHRLRPGLREAPTPRRADGPPAAR